MTRQRYYVVFIGRNPGVYETWDEAKAQVDGFPGNKHKRYNSLECAEDALLNFYADSYYNQRSRISKSQVHQIDGNLTIWISRICYVVLGVILCIALAHICDSE